MQALLLSSVVLALSNSPSSPPALEDWSAFRGPGGAGVATDRMPLPDRLDPESNRLWRVELPPGHSSPCLAGGRIFVTGESEDGLTTVCVEAATGARLWSRSLTVEALERTHEVHGPASSTPVSDGERVVVHFGSFGLVAYDVEGEELWRRPLERRPNTFGSASSPIMAGGRLVFLSDANEGSFLESLDPATGESQWRRDRSSFRSGWSTPVLRGADELLVYGVGWLTAYGLEDGVERWSLPGLTDEPITLPVLAGDHVLVTSYNMNTNPEVIGLPAFEALLELHDHDGSGTLSQAEAGENESVLSRYDADGEGDHPLRIFFRFLDADGDGELEAEEWPKLVHWLGAMQHANALIALQPPGVEASDEAKVLWQHARGVPECPTPVVVDGRIYMVKNGGIATCLDATTGELHFEGRTGARGPHYASPVAGDGKVFTIAARGSVAVLEAGKELRVLSRTELDERVLSTPALQDGVVYVRSVTGLSAFAELE